MRTSKIQWILLAVCFLLVPLGASAGTLDGDRFWTTVGSAGTLDEESDGKVFFDRAVVQKGTVVLPPKASGQMRTTGTSGSDETDSAVIRYNVTAVDGLFGTTGARMAVRFLDAGKGARVTAQLIEVDIETGAKATLLTFDSDAVPAQDGYHMGDVCDARVPAFDFVRKAYYIEGTLTTNSMLVGSVAGIEAIQLDATLCP